MAQKWLIDTRGLAKVSRMELVARQTVEGFVTGRHPSPYHGSSVEYADHRSYSLGDEIRSIDWKLLAKTDKYFIKLFEEQTNLHATILLDISKSMDFGEAPAPPAVRGQQATISKFEYGCYLAAALAYLMLRQNDSVGLCLFDNRIRHHLPCRATPSHFRQMIQLMEETRPRHDTRTGAVLHELAARIKRRGMVILISDLLDDVDAITGGLAHFRYNRHELVVFHVLDEAELSFPYERLTRFRDAEGAGSIVANPQSVRQRYLRRMADYLEQTRLACLERDISYQLARTGEPYEQLLMGYLHGRNRRK